MARILVVEDEPAIAELITLNLRHDGHEVQVAGSSQDAEAAIRAALPDLVLLDWMLPGESGLQLAQRWRRDVRTRDLPIVMLTARSEERDMVQGLDGGSGGCSSGLSCSAQHRVLQRGIDAGAHGHEAFEITHEMGLIDILPVERPDPLERGIEHELGKAAHEPLAPQQQLGRKTEGAGAEPLERAR